MSFYINIFNCLYFYITIHQSHRERHTNERRAGTPKIGTLIELLSSICLMPIDISNRERERERRGGQRNILSREAATVNQSDSGPHKLPGRGSVL